MRYSVAYDKALEIGKSLRDSLSQRLNFFLVGTAFLVVGLASLMASSNNGGLTNGQLTLAYTINGLGLYLALFFTMVAFLNLLIVGDFEEYIYALEKRLVEEPSDAQIAELPPAAKVKEIADSKMRYFPWFLVKELLTEIYGLCSGQQSAAAKTNHTYLVPILFVVGWIVVFFLVLPWRWVAATVVFGSIGFVPVIWSLRYLKRYLRLPSQKIPQVFGATEDKMRKAFRHVANLHLWPKSK